MATRAELEAARAAFVALEIEQRAAAELSDAEEVELLNLRALAAQARTKLGRPAEPGDAGAEAALIARQAAVYPPKG